MNEEKNFQGRRRMSKQDYLMLLASVIIILLISSIIPIAFLITVGLVGIKYCWYVWSVFVFGLVVLNLYLITKKLGLEK